MALGAVHDLFESGRLESSSRPFSLTDIAEGQMVELQIGEQDRLDWALKVFKKKVQKAGILKDLRRRRHYVKPSEARQMKANAARRRSRTAAGGRTRR